MTNNQMNRIIGWQVLDAQGKFPVNMTEHDVFRSDSDALAFIKDNNESVSGFIIYPKYQRDEDDEVRNYRFHGRKPRTFTKNERVFVATENGSDVYMYGTCRQNMETETDDDTVTLSLTNPYAPEEIIVGPYSTADIYQLAADKYCPRCGSPLFVEHNDNIDYAFYCAECDENFDSSIGSQGAEEVEKTLEELYDEFVGLKDRARNTVTAFIHRAIEEHETVSIDVPYADYVSAENDGKEFDGQFPVCVTCDGRHFPFKFYPQSVYIKHNMIYAHGYNDDDDTWDDCYLRDDLDTLSSVAYFIRYALYGGDE